MTTESDEYEAIVGRIAEATFRCVEQGADASMDFGRKNLWTGASGYAHQIDVSIKNSGTVLLVECKRWKRKVDDGHILLFAARLIDLRGARLETVHGVIATTRPVQRGAAKIAEYFKIDLAVVQSEQEFAFRYKHLFSIGVQSRGIGNANADLDRIPSA